MKKRIFYLDAIRVLAMLAVVFFHFQTAIDSYYPQLIGFPFGFTSSNEYSLGAFGVSLFFVLSGSALMIGKGQKISDFYKKRFFSIYPSFWLAWIVAWLASILLLNEWTYFCSIAPWKIVMSLTAMDGYLLPYGLNYYIVGEWFLGAILLIYLFVPLIKCLVEKQPLITGVVLALGWIITNCIYNRMLPIDHVFYMRILEVAAECT